MRSYLGVDGHNAVDDFLEVTDLALLLALVSATAGASPLGFVSPSSSDSDML